MILLGLRPLPSRSRAMAGSRRRRLMTVVSLLLLVWLTSGLGIRSAVLAGPADPCGPPVVNPVACENTQPGTPASTWDVGTSSDPSILGFTTDVSVNVGQTVHFKISTTAPVYTIDIYRLGYYQGNGARKITSVAPSAPPQNQPACLTDAATGLIDCGNWAESATWPVPTTAVSGVYLALLTRSDNTGQSHVLFVVRNDASHSDLLFQTSDSTWQAYNTYGGNSLYSGTAPAGRAYKVSYNRPLTTRNFNTTNSFFYAEFPAVQFLEGNGYDVSYFSGVDAARHGTLIQNHKTYVSSGHDEYWSGPQRANVTAARDAGVNLLFLSGNEVFWKTRWEASIDGSGTGYRTMVTYKETHANNVIDPADPPTWTGTWRDPRFSPPADGGQAENALTGQLWTINDGSGAIRVPAQYAPLRFWRRTNVASLTGNQVATLGQDTLGYEWDEEPDNGFRPAGLFDLSSTTLGNADRLVDYGSNTSRTTATHNMSLYRAASGALVFGAGTVQWTWGFTTNHDGLSPGDVADVTIQQATVNVLADMGAQPATLMAGMVAAAESTDTTPPTSTITSPSTGTNFSSGQTVSITGTAQDTTGVVAAVEVSTDNGATWHRATGRTSWAYTWQAAGAGTVVIKSRAVDDSANLETPSAGVQVNVGCPCSIWNTSTLPAVDSASDGSPIEVGVKFRSDVDATVNGIRFYKGSTNTGTHTGHLWTSTGALLASVTFSNETASGWQQANFSPAVAVSQNVVYVISYFSPVGRYAYTAKYFYPPQSPPPVGGSIVDNGPIHALRNSVLGANGVFQYGTSSAFPNNSFEAANYWVDVLYTPSTSGTGQPPMVTSVSPADGTSNVPTAAAVAAAFNRSITPTSLRFTLNDSSGASVAAAVTYDDPSRTATLRPSAALAAGTLYSASVQATDTVGDPMASPKTWSFLTAGGRVCTCTIFLGSQAPSSPSASDPDAVNLGVKFRSDVAGLVTGVRFYKGAGNTGTHIGSLWDSTGNLLATATFGNESRSGWQNVGFSTPVSIAAHTTYVASYLAPAGHYANTISGFATRGVDSPPLHALAAGVDGANGVYAYGGTNAFPNNSYKSTNYWVDAVFEPTPGRSSPPTVVWQSPAAGATAVSVTTPVSAGFNEPVTGASIVVRNPGGQAVPGATYYDPVSHAASFGSASGLQYGTSYTVTATASDLTSAPMASPVTWSFTTGPPPCPCTIWPGSASPANPDSGDGSSIEVGVKFSADLNGVITGVRFYKASTNTGTHIGNLWSLNGSLLASAVFTGETTSGWQQATFSGAVPVTAGQTFVASYFTPTGHYSSTPAGLTTAVNTPPLHALADGPSGGNGVFHYGSGSTYPSSTYHGGNYWVDVVFASSGASDSTPPTVTATTPAAGATGVATSATPTATFSEAVAQSSINFTLTPNGGSAVAGSLTYDLTSRTATYVPTAGLSPGTSYTATVLATDLYGNAMTSPLTWTFTTQPVTCPCSVFPASAVPASIDSGDGSPIEVGMKLRSDVNATVTAIRFYKATANTGTHTGHLWTTSGTVLASVTFTGETASGWQTASLGSPVAIAAGTTYIVSYFTPAGHYSATPAGFLNSGVDNPPLHGLANGVDGGNGVFNYAPSSAFPSSTYNGGNYWVDVVITTP